MSDKSTTPIALGPDWRLAHQQLAERCDQEFDRLIEALTASEVARTKAELERDELREAVRIIAAYWERGDLDGAVRDAVAILPEDTHQ